MYTSMWQESILLSCNLSIILLTPIPQLKYNLYTKILWFQWIFCALYWYSFNTHPQVIWHKLQLTTWFHWVLKHFYYYYLFFSLALSNSLYRRNHGRWFYWSARYRITCWHPLISKILGNGDWLSETVVHCAFQSDSDTAKENHILYTPQSYAPSIYQT